jgi:hypothetical protein
MQQTSECEHICTDCQRPFSHHKRRHQCERPEYCECEDCLAEMMLERHEMEQRVMAARA